ncbi:hypothetical protein C7974DRAFT_314149 [Boeremia exigua]|uniref:uncharacterized protein n=1 Tax=Boeremia exigua TaxID=749465 RepID=UPI001E8D6D35|nr:uncharacterized protein C7974DRAFT_314149 [Boeremia exigua]KAH6622417.1 hypothetical protein C7974DRAFT_314149 [Boeremia exigua]
MSGSLPASKPRREVEGHCRSQIEKRIPGPKVGPRPVPSRGLSELSLWIESGRIQHRPKMIKLHQSLHVDVVPCCGIFWEMIKVSKYLLG